jgi:microcystin-dependent protein
LQNCPTLNLQQKIPLFMSDPYVGEVRMVGFNFAPSGWALCSGQLEAISQNTTLFTLIGTTYGGNGTSTFALPDLRGRLALGQGQGPGLSNYVQGEISGSENSNILASNMPAHNHAVTGGVSVATTIGITNVNADRLGPNGHILAPAVAFTSPPAPIANFSDQAPNGSLGGVSSVATPSLNTALAGGNIPFAIAQPYLVINYVISLFGIFPSRN